MSSTWIDLPALTLTGPITISGTVAVTQSGVWSVGRTWVLDDSTDSVTVTQGTNPWIISGNVNSSQAGLWDVSVNNFPPSFIVNQGTSPWVTSVTNFPAVQPVNQSGSWTTGRTWVLDSSTDSVAISGFPSTISVTQGTSPWVVSGTIAATQSGAWTTGRTWALDDSTDSVTVVQGTTPWTVDGTVNAVQSGTWTVDQGTSPWVISGTVTSTPSGTQDVNVVSSVEIEIKNDAGSPIPVTATDLDIRDLVFATDKVDTSGSVVALDAATLAALETVTVLQGTSPWVVSGTVAATQSGTWTTGRTWTLSSVTDSVNIGNFPATVAVTQSTLPWVVSGTVTTSNSDDHNYGTVGANTLRTAAQIGNATGAADFNAGATGAQTLRVASNQGAPGTAANAWFQKITDGTDIALVTAAGELNVIATAQPGVDIGDVTVNNASGAAAVNIQDGGNSITVDGTVGVSNLPTTVDTNYGTVGASTIRTASQIGNTTGGANFNAGTVGAQTLRVIPASGGTGTTSSVASSVTSVQLLAANTARLGVIIYNDGNATLKIKFGTTASATDFSVEIPGNTGYEMWAPLYNGRIDGIWTTALGSARITEIT